ncbi:MAG: hypothetical protein Q7R35_08845 [Elusimicrobiota bacterium]|nr:hypothetical protein [Elusimicrobiota bacterium]
MKKILMVMCLVFGPAAAGGLPAVAAGPAAFGETAPGAEKEITVKFSKIPLPDFLAYISSATGTSFKIQDPLIKYHTITVFVRKTTAAKLMELMTRTTGFEFKQDSDGSFVVKKALVKVPFPPLTRQDMEDPLLKTLTGNIRVTDAPLSVFLDIVSAQAQVNFVIAEEAAETKITVSLKQTTVGDILQLLKSRGLECSRVANTNTFVVRTSVDGNNENK